VAGAFIADRRAFPRSNLPSLDPVGQSLEINDFEHQIAAHGNVLAKFWLHVDAKEQLRRFRERETVAWKRHKIGPEDRRLARALDA
jgi:polyphosphate kinase 2 (PPK2 family)